MAPSLEFWLYLPQMRLTMDQMVERGPGGRSRRLPRHGRHGPPGPAARREPGHVRADGRQHLGGRPHQQPQRRLARAVRLLPPSGHAGPRGRLPRPRLERPLRARHRLGLGRGGNGDVRPRLPRVEATGQPAEGVARGHHGAVDRRAGRLRGRALHPARCPAATHPAHPYPHRHRRRGPQDHGAGGGPRRLVERPHRHPRQVRRDATPSRSGPLLAAGSSGLHSARARTARR